MRKKNNFEVIIIGGGIAGTTAALYLEKQGIKDVVILEKAKFPRLKPCTGLITSAAYKLLLELNIDPIKDLNYLSSHKNKGIKIFYKEKLKKEMHPQAELFVLEEAVRYNFDDYLRKKTIERGISFQEKIKINNIDFEEKLISTSKTTYKYKYLIFADGINGYSAKYADIKEKNICLEAVFKTEDKNEKPFYYLYFGETEQGYAWFGRTLQHCTIGFSDKYNSQIDYPAKLVAFAKKQGYEIDQKIVRGAFTPIAIAKNLTLHDQAMLIGDAAGITNALTIEGIYGAIFSAKQAANAIKQDDITLYIKGIDPLIREQKTAQKLLKRFFKPIFQFLMWDVYNRLFPHHITEGYDKIILEKKYSMDQAFKQAIKKFNPFRKKK